LAASAKRQHGVKQSGAGQNEEKQKRRCKPV
jgi:hypothetical protein